MPLVPQSPRAVVRLAPARVQFQLGESAQFVPVSTRRSGCSHDIKHAGGPNGLSCSGSRREDGERDRCPGPRARETTSDSPSARLTISGRPAERAWRQGCEGFRHTSSRAAGRNPHDESPLRRLSDRSRAPMVHLERHGPLGTASVMQECATTGGYHAAATRPHRPQCLHEARGSECSRSLNDRQR